MDNLQTLVKEAGPQQIFNVRTMKKDLKRLREADSLKEREKISKLNPFKPAPEESPEPLKKPSLPVAAEEALKLSPNLQNRLIMEKHIAQQQADKPAKPVPKEPEKVTAALSQALKEHSVKEQALQERIKDYANEEEKQQIFLLQSQKSDLENRMAKRSAANDSSLLLEKNNILIEQKNWQKKLAPIVAEEEKNDGQQKELQEKESKTVSPSEKQELEKQRWTLEDKRQEIEKSRWFIEGEMKKLDDKVKTLDASYKEANTNESTLKQSIASIDNSLRAIYVRIAQRESEKLKNSAPPAQASLKTPAPAAQSQPKPPIQAQAQPEGAPRPLPERPYMKKIPAQAQEKLAQDAQAEQEKRRRFIEDVEKWANEKKQAGDTSATPPKNTNNTPNNG